jgi:hypothetical protein
MRFKANGASNANQEPIGAHIQAGIIQIHFATISTGNDRNTRITD